jgi:phosphotransferase system enzyme I (PtsI)
MTKQTIIWEGIAASPGYAIGKALVYSKQSNVPERLAGSDPATEKLRLKQAVADAIRELEALRVEAAQRIGEKEAGILDGHIMLLGDPELVDAAYANIEAQHINAEYALYEIAQSFIEVLKSMDDEQMRSRAADLSDVTDRVIRHLQGRNGDDLNFGQGSNIIFAEDLTPSMTASLDLNKVSAIVNRLGSSTSHSAIIARTLELPAVTGVKGDLSLVEDGAEVIVDGVRGIVILHPDSEQIAEYAEKREAYQQERQALMEWATRSTVTADGRRVEVAANISGLSDLEKVVEHGAEGIGLFRTEFLFMDGDRVPTEDEQFSIYKHVLQKMEGKPVIIRTLDIGGDKEVPHLNLPKEDNPFLGERGIRLCFSHEELFRSQLSALLRASRYGNLHIMFPMIAVLEEWRRAKAMLQEEKDKLRARGIPVAEFIAVGMMVEVPSAAISAHQFAREVDFFSIGTNDLIQYTMAADRMNKSVAYLYQPLNPSVLRLIQMVAEAAHAAGKWVGVCGAMAEDAEAYPILLGLGIDELSVSSSSILSVRRRLSELSYGEMSSAASELLKLGSQEEVREYLSKRVSS